MGAGFALPSWVAARDISHLDRAATIAAFKVDDDPRPKHIYILIDPRDGEIRYVGKSVRPNDRLTNHMNEPPTNCHRSHWLQQLKSLGLRPHLHIVETITDDWPWQESEIYWIETARANGCNLVNNTKGGDGVIGLPEDTRRRISKAWVGRKHRPESLAKIGAASRLRKHSPERRRHMSQKMKGRTVTWNDKLSQALTTVSFEDCLEIRKKAEMGYSSKSLAAEYGTHHGIVNKIKQGKYPNTFPYKFKDGIEFEPGKPPKFEMEECQIIRALHRNGYSVVSIASAFRADKTTVTRIVRGQYPSSSPYAYGNEVEFAKRMKYDGYTPECFAP